MCISDFTGIQLQGGSIEDSEFSVSIPENTWKFKYFQEVLYVLNVTIDTEGTNVLI